MAGNDSVIDALTRALEASPDDAGIRLHLASLLIDAGRFEDALEHCREVLKTDPVNLDALGGARKSAAELGEDDAAAGYATLLEKLDPAAASTAAEAEEAPEPQRVTSDGPPHLRVVGGSNKDHDPDVEADSDELRITLEDVAGLEAVKRRIDLAFLGPIRNPAMAKAYGKRMRGGLLLYGPPGCGKTYIARALAGELRANFMSIGLNDVLNMWLGESQQQLHQLFETARQRAPTVMFMDELDALGRKRSELRYSGIREIVNQLLQELDGVGTGDEAVFVLGATNLPWDIDVALKRPGRFDRAIFVEPPDLVARQRILELNLADRPTEKVDLKKLAKRTQGYSGADLAFICEAATEIALERAMETGKMEPITARALEAAMKETRPSTQAWFETARNYAMFANSSGEFNDLAEYIEANRI